MTVRLDQIKDFIWALTDLMDLATFTKAQWFLTINAHIERQDSSNNINLRLFMVAKSVRHFTACEQYINETPQILVLRDTNL